MRRVLRLGWRFLTVGIVNALSLLTAVLVIPGIEIEQEAINIFAAIISALCIGLANALIRPMLVYLTYPVNLLTIGLPTIILDSFLLLLLGKVLPGFRVDQLWPSAVLGAVVLPLSNITLTTLTNPERQRTLYDFVLRKLGRPGSRKAGAWAERGMIFVQIDGLSYVALRNALRLGKMPALQELVDAGSHRLLAWDCGLPSATSATQAGIMYGNNFDIPAFRWFDRQLKRIIVSNRPDSAKIIESRCATNPGLLREGSSVNNVLSGDARHNIFTVSALGNGNPSRRMEDFLLFLLNPYCMLRIAGLVVWDLLMEYLGSWRQRLRRETPRVSRRGFYPLLRVISNVVLREISTYLVLLDIMRGVPVIYVTYLGFDEVSHFVGPRSPDTFEPLIGIDNQIRRIRKIMRRDAPIPYELIILSDHGQSESVPFSQQYGQRLPDLVKNLIAGDSLVRGDEEDRELPSHLMVLLEELREAERVSPGRLVPRAVHRGRRALQRYSVDKMKVESGPVPGPPASARYEQEVLVLCSGNLAHLYFEHSRHPLSLEEIERHYPQLVAELARHPGIGFVLGRSEWRGLLIIGAHGFRELETGLVVGDDPLASFGDPNYLTQHVLRLLRYPNAGDLVINGALHDGRVVSFEEHVGTHGGLGGAQTQPFVIYPADMRLDGLAITDATTLYSVFRARRERYAEPPYATYKEESNHIYSKQICQ